MGKHSKTRSPLLPRSRKPMLATALIPMVGVCAAAAAAATDDAQVTAAPAASPTTAAAPEPATAGHPAPARSNTPTSLPTRPAHDLTVAPVRATPPPPMPASVTDGQVPATNYRAYKQAADTIARTEPVCGIDWKLIAGIGKVESHHADNGDVDPSGRLKTPIYGPTLDGSLAGNQVITDTDGGAIDGDPVHDRAVGPMQFIPQTWKKYAADGNGDGIADPQNIYDAALTSARYLCDGGLNLRDIAGQTAAVLRYNNSMTYVDNVLGFARSY
ncbi:lytic murein transglycosylase [Gordonia sp. N1V]|uniref:lytic transglycosylase domain-containing protein n=1 Tax=Gordonia sp. N1V TaxID=3034163 RepID=UPI0023E0FA0C|nr:lytic murein transglycosylase [Gordonia sp. N1V]MDF3283639.1 lytic murein transglycosylase [Gordonia sp. N1V]